MSFNLHHIRYFCLFFKNVLLENVLCNLFWGHFWEKKN